MVVIIVRSGCGWYRFCWFLVCAPLLQGYLNYHKERQTIYYTLKAEHLPVICPWFAHIALKSV